MKRWLFICTLAGLALFQPSLPAASPSAWPQFLGPNRDGSYEGPALRAVWPKAGPPILWSKEVGEGFSGPVVVPGKVVLFHRRDNQEVVECLDSASGNRLWSAQYPTAYRDDFGFDEGPRATPTVRESRLFTFGAEGLLHCWELETGKKLWGVDVKKDFAAAKGFFGIACSPLVEGDRLLLSVGGQDGAGIVAFDPETGKEIWRATDDEASYSSPVAAPIRGQPAFLALTRSHLVALAARDGQLLFQHPFRPPIRASVTAASPLVIGDLVFISASYNTGAALLRITDPKPEVVWAGDEILSNHYATSVHHAGYLYGFDGRQEQGCNLRCVELATGQVRWSEERFGAGTLIRAHDTLLILTEKGELLQAPASPEKFQPRQRAQILGFGTRAYPALADAKLYARDKRNLVCVDLGGAP